MFRHRIDDHLELRIFEDIHVDDLYALVINNRAHARQWLPWVDDTKSVEDTKAFIRRSLERFARQDGFQCGVFEDAEARRSDGLGSEEPLRWQGQ